MKRCNWIYALCTMLFGVAVLLFFALAYPHHLHYQEQYQLFLFNWGYVREVLATGGVADLIGRFLTQFFLYAWVGASIIAVLMAGIQLLTYRLIYNWTIYNLQLNDSSFSKTDSRQSSIKQLSIKSSVAYVLSFIPSILCVCFLTDENALMTLPVALFIVLALVLLNKVIYNWTIDNLQLNGKSNSRQLSIKQLSIILTVCAIGYIIFSTRHCYRTDDMPAPWSWVLIDKAKLQQKEEIMAYDFMARHGLWNRIIQKAQQRAPKNQISVVALNLALAERGALVENLSKFPQNGIAGLLPNYNKDSFSSLVTAEAFYRLGLINTAQRFVFESQEAIPDFQKSARCYKRLAETNLINGSYEVARKYLNALTQTLFYRSWAIETLELLSDEAVDNHPVYGELRKLRCHEDYFFGGNSPQQILIKQLEANPDNRMAQQYLKAAIMLQKNR